MMAAIKHIHYIQIEINSILNMGQCINTKIQPIIPEPIATIIPEPIASTIPESSQTYCGLQTQRIRSEPCSAMLSRITNNPNQGICTRCTELEQW